MPGFKVQVKGIPEVTSEFGAAARIGLENGIEKLGLVGVAAVQQFAPVAFGVLANSIQSEVERGDHALTAIIFAGPPADVYAAPVETGTRPHFPPPQALLPWVKLKFQPSDEKQALSIAYAIARSMSKKGTKPQPYFEKAIGVLQSKAQGVMEVELARALTDAGFGGKQ